MKCPNCNETLLLSERHDIQIDYCPSCRGVWLDKGELDKMLDQATRKHAASNTDMQIGDNGYLDSDSSKQHHNYNKQHKKRSFLGDLFDFD